MKKTETRVQPDARLELVTTTFVASGRPDGMRDLDQFIETLNSLQLSQQITLMDPAVRPLYRASDQLHLSAPLLVRREEIVFANFEGPASVGATASMVSTATLLLAPPFQIQGVVSLPRGADAAQALRGLLSGFFVVRHASVFDADGNALGEGEQIVVNGAAVQMASPTAEHIDVVARARQAELAPSSVDAAIATEASATDRRAA